MSEYWKSTPKYWCKHCSCYVRDTKVERQNHETTAKHQGALKRFLRDLHRGHEREEREKDRARQEIARLNGVVNGSSSSSSSGPSGSGARNAAAGKAAGAAPTESQLKSQREQLVALGVAVPDDFRPEMAMPGEWTVTSTRVIEDRDEEQGEGKVAAKATGIRKREETEEEKEEEEAVRGLFKKPRRWGRDSKTMPQDEDAELDALLSGTMPLKQQTDVKPDVVKKEEDGEDVKKEDIAIKEEPDTESRGFTGTKASDEPLVKSEVEPGDTGLPGPAVVFKKRKPKGIRSK